MFSGQIHERPVIVDPRRWSGHSRHSAHARVIGNYAKSSCQHQCAAGKGRGVTNMGCCPDPAIALWLAVGYQHSRTFPTMNHVLVLSKSQQDPRRMRSQPHLHRCCLSANPVLSICPGLFCAMPISPLAISEHWTHRPVLSHRLVKSDLHWVVRLPFCADKWWSDREGKDKTMRGFAMGLVPLADIRMEAEQCNFHLVKCLGSFKAMADAGCRDC